ncbi:hypothetical protein AERO9A_460003 [Aeromonas salmonicida]|nr:hypothetical protein AERO9A_460003 [Aeromonas salmonicida]
MDFWWSYQQSLSVIYLKCFGDDSMLTLASHYLVQGWLVCWVELFGGARVGSVSRAARGDKEGTAGDGAADGAVLVDGHWGEPVHDMAATNSAAIRCEHRHGGAV